MKTFNPDTTFFSSDLHFLHKNIIKFQENRKFDSIEEMNEKIVKNWNNKISDGDDVFLMGDVAMGSKPKLEILLSRLKGNIHLIEGNHDFLNNDRFREYFVSIKKYNKISVDKQRIILFHYPIYDWDEASHGSWHLHGHTHNTYFGKGKVLDVGIDANPNLEPFSFEEIKELMKDKKIKKHYEDEL